MKPRKKPSQRRRALLQKEINSCCPFCGCQEVDTFEVHHLNENPDDDRFENELMVCPTCHAKINVGTIPRNDVYKMKESLMKASGQLKNSSIKCPAPHEGIVQINHGDNVIQAAGQVTIKMPRGRRAKAAVPVSGVIGTCPKERAYIKHLYDRLFDYKKAIPGYDDARAGKTVARYIRDMFGSTWSYVPIDRFDALVELLQKKINETPLGRKHKRNCTKAYSSFEEFSNK